MVKKYHHSVYLYHLCVVEKEECLLLLFFAVSFSILRGSFERSVMIPVCWLKNLFPSESNNQHDFNKCLWETY